MKTQKKWIIGAGALLAISVVVLFTVPNPSRKPASLHKHDMSHKATVLEDGMKIVFPKESPGLRMIRTEPTKKETKVLRVTVPARVVASANKPEKGENSNLLFDSTELTSIYAQYRQSKGNFARSSKNLERVRDMYRNQAATVRDLNDAQSDFANAQATKAEAEGKLRSLGLDPQALDSTKPGGVWIIADVPESQLREVEKGEDVQLTLSSFPDQVFQGKAAAIGDVVDPFTRTVRVRVSLLNEKKVLPGMYGKADFGTTQNAVMTVPLTSVVSVEEQNYLFVQKADGEFERRKISMVSASPDFGIVSDGVKEGETIVTSGAILLKGLSFGF